MSSINITEVEGIMRMGVNQQTQLNSLLTYYRNKVEDCNRQRQEWIAKYDQCKFDADLKHKLQWENRHLKDKIEQLERALSHHKTALYDERQNYLKLIRQNTQLKKKTSQDSRKIKQLINVCEPLQSGMVMCKDIKPELTNTFIVNDLNIHKNNNGSFSGNGTSLADRVKSANSTTAAMTRQKKPAKTNVYVPQSQEIQTSHQLELMSLKKQFDAQMGNLFEQNSVLKEQLSNLRDKHNEKFENQVENYRQLLERHTDLQKKHNNLAQDYFSIRMRLTENQQRVQQSNELLRVKNLFLAEKMKQQQKKYEKESKAIEQLVSKRNNDFKTKYKQQMRKKQQHLSILKQQYEKIQQIYLNKIKTLQDHLTKLNDKYNDLLKKSKRQITYLQAQLKVMQKRVQSQQVQKMRLQIQQLQQQQRRKSQQQQREQIRLKKQVSDKKKQRMLDIQKAYRNPQKLTGKFKKMKQVQQQSQQSQQSSSVAQVDSQDIDNIQRHIQELQQKLGLDK